MIGRLLQIAQIVLPLSILLYSAWLWDQGTSPALLIIISLLNFWLSLVVFRRSSADGVIEVERFPDGTKRYSLNLEEAPEDWDTKKKIIFHVEDSRE